VVVAEGKEDKMPIFPPTDNFINQVEEKYRLGAFNYTLYKDLQITEEHLHLIDSQLLIKTDLADLEEYEIYDDVPSWLDYCAFYSGIILTAQSAGLPNGEYQGFYDGRYHWILTSGAVIDALYFDEEEPYYCYWDEAKSYPIAFSSSEYGLGVPQGDIYLDADDLHGGGTAPELDYSLYLKRNQSDAYFSSTLNTTKYKKFMPFTQSKYFVKLESNKYRLMETGYMQEVTLTEIYDTDIFPVTTSEAIKITDGFNFHFEEQALEHPADLTKYLYASTFQHESQTKLNLFISTKQLTNYKERQQYK
jgi:hypothetical protein